MDLGPDSDYHAFGHYGWVLPLMFLSWGIGSWALAELGQPKCGLHAFRRFRNTYLRNYTSTPPGVYRFWMGHASADGDMAAGESMSDRYDKAEHERALRKEWAERAGLGFELPSKIRVIGPNGLKLNSETLEGMAVSA